MWDGKAIWFVICLGQIQHTVKLDQIWSALRNDFEKIFDHLSTLFITIKIKQRISANVFSLDILTRLLLILFPLKHTDFQEMFRYHRYLKIIFIFVHKLKSIIIFDWLHLSIHPAQKIADDLFFDVKNRIEIQKNARRARFSADVHELMAQRAPEG